MIFYSVDLVLSVVEVSRTTQQEKIPQTKMKGAAGKSMETQNKLCCAVTEQFTVMSGTGNWKYAVLEVNIGKGTCGDSKTRCNCRK